MSREAGETCIDCPTPITAEALKLNASGLWCVAYEKKRRKWLDASFAAISESFTLPGSTGDTRQ